MGKEIFDQYSFFHIGSGYLARYTGKLKFWQAILGHVAFEIVENTDQGIF